jgi:hypothetical protein
MHEIAIERPPWDIGDIVEWMHVPVAVLSTPEFRHAGGRVKSWYSRATYLRLPRQPFEYRVGQIIPDFQMGGKYTWDALLTDEEEALVMRLLLTGESL